MPQLLRYLNALGLLAVSVILLFAFYDQFSYRDLPCPLCLLQRVGFVAVMFGFLLNIQNGLKACHYGVILIAAFFGAAVALRQISLHVIPGLPGYGDLFLGLHYYTWAFVCFCSISLGVSVLLMIPSQYESEPNIITLAHQPVWVKGIIALALLTIVMNVVAAFFECGLGACSDNPTTYKYLLK